MVNSLAHFTFWNKVTEAFIFYWHLDFDFTPSVVLLVLKAYGTDYTSFPE